MTQLLGRIRLSLKVEQPCHVGNAVYLNKKDHYTYVWRNEQEVIIKTVKYHSRRALDLENAILQLVLSQGIRVGGVVVQVEGESCAVDVEIRMSPGFEENEKWKRGPRNLQAIKVLLQALYPQIFSQKQNSNAGQFTLASCFRELSAITHKTQQNKSQNYEQQQNQENQQNNFDRDVFMSENSNFFEQNCNQQQVIFEQVKLVDQIFEQKNVLGLSDEIWQRIMKVGTVSTFQRMICSCKYFRKIGDEIVPGLRVELYPHQTRAMLWMLDRERNGGVQIPHPHIMHFSSDEGAEFNFDMSNGDLTMGDVPMVQDIAGGLCCDEPGLGKTVTALSLILKTLGQSPKVEAGTNIKHVLCRGFMKLGWYQISQPKKRKREDSKRSQQLSDEYYNSTPEINNNNNNQCENFHQVNITSGKNRLSNKSKFESEERPTKWFKIDPISGQAIHEQVNLSINKKQPVGECLVEFQNWVKCDDCGIYRPISMDQEIDSDQPWFCLMHPHKQYQKCHQQENSQEFNFTEDQVVTEAGGFVFVGDEQGQKKNIDFFKQLIQNINSQPGSVPLSKHWSPLWQLLEMDAEKLAQGKIFKAGRNRATNLKNYTKFMQQISFQRVPELPKLHKTRNQKRSPKFKLNAWMQPRSHRLLRLDKTALKIALENGDDLEVQQIMYISATTLIIAPRTLIPHWEQQIHQHVSAKINYVVYDPSTEIQTQQLSSKELAWNYDVVITTFQALSQENKRVSNKSYQSPFLNIHWFRIILDEGHQLGSSGITGKLQMACKLKGERRWVMTGTPAPNVSSQDTVHLQPLLAFLKHVPYGVGGSQDFQRAIVRPFSQRCPDARNFLLNMLQRVMIRTSKEQLQNELPELFVEVVRLEFEGTHKTSYEQLVELIRLNLLLGDWKDPDHNESLLNIRNSKHASTLFKNILLSCNLAGILDVSPGQEDLVETLILICERHKQLTEKLENYKQNQHLISDFEILPQNHPLKRIENGLKNGGTCNKCEKWHRMLCMTPCAHLLCSTCLELSRLKCSFCDLNYKMQSTKDPDRKNHNSNPKWDVPVELIEWQPALVQKGATGASGGEWQPTWEITQSSKVNYVINKINSFGNKQKVIIFSKFWQHLKLIKSKFEQAGINCAEFKKGAKDVQNSLDKFRLCEFVNVLLLDESGSVGLDLSFANRVFLMEPLPDLSLEHQIVSRAHRMGQKNNVYVEILVMKNTVEEVIVNLRKKVEDQGGADMRLEDEIDNEESTGIVNRTQKDRFVYQQLLLRNHLFQSLFGKDKS